MVLENVYGQNGQPVSSITQGCGVEHNMTDPDANIRLDLMRDCATGGPEGGGSGGD